MEDIKAIYSLIVRCLQAGKMDKTVERLQGILRKEVEEMRNYV